MIRNDEELKHVQQQAARVELVVRSLREKITNDDNFRLYAESAVDMLMKLRAEIDQYLGIPLVLAPPQPLSPTGS